MAERLEGKTAVITGGTEGIDLATTRLFVVEEGAFVFIRGRRQKEPESSCDAITTDSGKQVHPFPMRIELIAWFGNFFLIAGQFKLGRKHWCAPWICNVGNALYLVYSAEKHTWALFAMTAVAFVIMVRCAILWRPRNASITFAALQPVRATAQGVTYPPGHAGAVHRHNPNGLIHVLEGSVVMGVRGDEPVTLGPGQTFYESPNDIHPIGRNPSKTTPAKFLVFLTKDKDAPISIPVK